MASNDNYGYRGDDDAYRRRSQAGRRGSGESSAEGGPGSSHGYGGEYDRRSTHARYEAHVASRSRYERSGSDARPRYDERAAYAGRSAYDGGAGYAGRSAYDERSYQRDARRDARYDGYDARGEGADGRASRQQARRSSRGAYQQDAYQRDAYQQGDYQRGGGSSRGERGRAQGHSYSRYDSADRYASAARERSNPRGGVGRGGSGGRGKGGGYALPGSGGRGGRGGAGLTLGGGRRKGLSTNAITAVVGIVVAAVIVIVGIVMWSNRSVPITLNGQEVSVRVGSTIDQVIEAQALELTPGNLISVSGNKIEDGTGYAYLAKLNDNELDGEATAAYRVAEGDSLTLENGRDRTEDYTVEIVEEQPKLEMGGDSWGNISYISQWPKKGQYEMRTGQRSGEVARGETLQETQNCVVSVHQITPDNDQKLVCLTFDDGPAETYTEAYIEILNKYGIHATFFNLGQNVEAYPELAKKIVESGNELMSHTYQHQQLSLLDAAALQEEFSSTFSTLESVAGVKTTSFRPPYGDFKESTWLASGGLASVSVLWNQDSLDWKRGGAESIVTNSLANITSGSIILMHDGGGERSQDVEALPQIIEQLQSEGYTFVTVTELMKSDSSIPEDIANGDATMPEDCTWPAELAETETTTSES